MEEFLSAMDQVKKVVHPISPCRRLPAVPAQVNPRAYGVNARQLACTGCEHTELFGSGLAVHHRFDRLAWPRLFSAFRLRLS